MEGRYTINIYNLQGDKIDTLYTNGEVITIGSGLCNSIRIQLPSILELHLKIYLDQKKVFVMGEDVKLNDLDLSIGEKRDFEIGDLIKIHGRSFQVEMTSPNILINQNKLIKNCLDNLKDSVTCYYEFDSGLFLNGEKNKTSINKEISQNDLKSETVVISNEINTKIQEEIIMTENNDEIKKVYTQDDNIVTTETKEDVTTKRETNIQTEVICSHYIKDGIIYEEIKEHVDIEDIKEIKNNEQDNDLKNNTKLQTAVKLIDASSSETKAEEALEEGDLSTIKEAIVSKQQDLDEEIKEVIDFEVVDTPINPLLIKKQPIDLGDVVIEKEIMKDAEKVVENKINQSSESINLVENSTNEEEKVDLTTEKSEVVNVIEENEVFINIQENTPLIEMTGNDKVQESVENIINTEEKEEVKEIKQEDDLEEKDLKGTNEFKEDLRENLEEKDSEGKDESKEKEVKKEEVENESKDESKDLEEKDELQEEMDEEDKNDKFKEEMNEEESKEKDEMTEKEVVDIKNKSADDKDFEKEHSIDDVKNKSADDKDDVQEKSKVKRAKKVKGIEKESESGFNKLNVEILPNQKDESKVSFSKLTVTPRSTRKASITNRSIETVPVATSKRVKRNASIIAGSKPVEDVKSKKSKSKK